MPFIVETIVTTENAAGEVHIAPLGLIADGSHWIIAPFKPSRTLDNLLSTGRAIANHTDDVRVFAGCVTGRRSWPLRRATNGAGAVLASAIAHWELQVDRFEDDAKRPRFYCNLEAAISHAAWGGFNRAQAAVIEAAVLVTRLGMLPADKIEGEIAYLKIAIDKTAGPRELEAWGWLMEKVEAWRQGDPSASRKA